MAVGAWSCKPLTFRPFSNKMEHRVFSTLADSVIEFGYLVWGKTLVAKSLPFCESDIMNDVAHRNNIAANRARKPFFLFLNFRPKISPCAGVARKQSVVLSRNL